MARWQPGRATALAAAVVACAAGAAAADTYTFEQPVYVPNQSFAGVTDPGTGQTWEIESTTQTAPFDIDDQVVSPFGGTKSARFVQTGLAGRFGVDLATPVSTGIVRLQWDYKATGGNITRVSVLNTAGRTAAVPATTEDILWQPFTQNGFGVTGQTAAVNGNYGWDNQGLAGAGAFGECNQCQQPLGPPTNCPADPIITTIPRRQMYCDETFSRRLLDGKPAFPAADGWYRIKFWFDLNNNGRVVYAAVYDIACGSEIQIAENHIAHQLLPLTASGLRDADGLNVRAFQLRSDGGPAGQTVWLDNITIAADPGFVPPPAVNAAPTGAPPANRADRAKTGTLEYNLPAGAGGLPSLAYDPGSGKVFSFDGQNGVMSRLASAAPGTAATALGGVGQLGTNGPGTGVMGVLEPGTATTNPRLISTAVNSDVTDPIDRDINEFNFATGTWDVLLSNSFFTGTTGLRSGDIPDHSLSVLSYGGVKHLLLVYNGARTILNLRPDTGGAADSIVNVGYWGNTATEVAPEGTYGESLFYTRQTLANGQADTSNRTTDGGQGPTFRGLFRADFGLGCDDAQGSKNARLSLSGNNLPWALNALDGGSTNRHQMEYVPGAGAAGRIWVLRGAGTNDVGVYDIATDTWGILKLFDQNVAPLNTDRADLQLVGAKMYVIAAGRRAVLSYDAIGEGSTTIPVVTPPSNDECAGAIALAVPSTTSGNNFTATGTTEAPALGCGGPAGNDLWYSVTPSATGDHTFSLCDTLPRWDAYMALYDDCANTQIEVACADDGCDGPDVFGTTGSFTASLDAGNTYVLRLGGWDGARGEFILQVTGPASACRADFNNDAAVNVSDIFAFLSAWFAELPSANINGDGAVDVSDIFAFLSIWFAGCP